ncbi:MAG TPA: efflux RND transporter permease subunit, partial [Thermoanaerobaculia bacterium]
EVLEVLESYPEVESTYAAIAPADGDTVQMAQIYIELTEKGERDRSQQEIMVDMRDRLRRVPGIVLSVEEDPDNMQKPLQLLVRGEEIGKLKEYAAAIKRKLYGIPGIVDLDATLEQELPEYRFHVDRERARNAGIGTDALVRTIGALIGGQVVSTFEDETGEAVDVRIRLPQELREDVGQVNDLRIAIPTRQGIALVPIGDLVTVERTHAASEITRQDMSRQVQISANLDGLPLGTAAERALEAAQSVPMAPGYSVRIAGDTEIMEESFASMFEALILAIIFVYLILAAQFESFIDPFAIMLSLPLSIVGMAGMLFLTRDTTNIMSLIGLILLMGLVTKNAILLVDFSKVLQRRGMERREAVITAGRTRLRPIMMTTLAMIFGMVPLALGIGQGAEMRAPMARAVIGGLITSTLLTLIVVPVVYTILDDLAMAIRRRWAGSVIHEGDEAPEAPAVPPQTHAPVPGVARGSVVLLLVAALLAPAAAWGAEPLTLGDAIGIANEKNRDLQKAREYQKWVQGKYLEERAAALPKVTLSGGAAESWDDMYQLFFGDVYPASQRTWQTGVGVSQVVFAWGKVGAAIEAAREGIASAEDQLEIFRQAAVRDTTEAFMDVLLARAMASIARSTLEQRERHLAQARRRFDLGVATDYDVLSANVAVENARPDLIRAENMVRVATERLRLVLGDPELDREAVGSLEAALEEPPQVQAVIDEALAKRPDLSELEHRIAVYEQLVRIARADARPRIDFSGRWGQLGLSAGGIDGTTENWTAGLFLSYPIFDGFSTRGRVVEAMSDLERQRIDIERARDEVALQARTTVDAVHESLAIVNALTGTVDQARRLLAMAERGYELGVKTRIDVEDAELNLRAAEANLARARRDHRVARTNLDWVRGAL